MVNNFRFLYWDDYEDYTDDQEEEMRATLQSRNIKEDEQDT